MEWCADAFYDYPKDASQVSGQPVQAGPAGYRHVHGPGRRLVARRGQLHELLAGKDSQPRRRLSRLPHCAGAGFNPGQVRSGRNHIGRHMEGDGLARCPRWYCV